MKLNKETKIGFVIGLSMVISSFLLEHSFFWDVKFWFIKKSFMTALDGVLLPSIIGIIILICPIIYAIIVIRKYKEKVLPTVITLFIFTILYAILIYYIKYEHYLIWADRGQWIVNVMLIGRAQNFIIAETIINTWFLFLLSVSGFFILSCILILQKPKIICYIEKALQKIKKYPQNPKARWWFWLLTIAILLRVIWILLIPSKPVEDFAIYNGFAKRLADGMGYVTENGTPTTYWPVGYPLFLSLLYRIFGCSLTIAKISSVLLSLSTIVLTFLLGKQCLSEKAGKTAAIIIALLPVQILYSNFLATENLFTPIVLLTIYLIVRYKEKLSVFLVIGALLGVASLVRPPGLALPITFLVYFLINKKKFKNTIIHFSIILVGMIVILLPWMIRNYYSLGKFTVSTKGGINFFIGNNEHATGRFCKNIAKMAPGKTELEIDVLGYSEGFKFIKANPSKFLLLSIKKMYFLYGNEMLALNWSFFTVFGKEKIRIFVVYVTHLTYLLLLFFTISGIIIWIRNYNPKLLMPALIIALWTLISFMFFGEDRFHFPLTPLFAIFASHAILRLCKLRK